ncbi:MAG: OmpA family protein [Bacteroidales bacterium]|jgi:outer membrane protein OmpA-like peptidoglycan-associated protein/tetratricopeptide (TPR) repeat protein
MYPIVNFLFSDPKPVVRWLSAALFLCISFSAYPNPVNDSVKVVRKEYKRKAKRDLNRENIYDAIANYEKYFGSGAKDVRSAYKLAGLYFFTRDYGNARKYYDSVITWSPEKFPLAYYYKGIVCRNEEMYDEAIESLSAFRKLYRGKRDPEEYRRKARDLIESSEWALQHADSSANISVSNLGPSVNRPHIEFSPFPLNGNEMIYGSYIEDSVTNKRSIRKLYRAEKTDDQWVFKGELEGPVNDPESHTGNAVVSADGKRMYFTRCRENWKGKTICEIYLSEYREDAWQEPRKLPYPVNDENFTSTQPALGQYLRTGADILYFVSDRPGTKGGMDIWYSIFDKRNNVFKEPRNAGRSINTREDECCPYYDPANRTLYFSSKGHHGFGGFDVYKATGSTRKWTDAVHLPKPVSTAFDETYYTTLSGGEDGFFTSNRTGSSSMRNGSCCDDIFYFRYNECSKVVSEGTVINVTNYDVYDELNKTYKLDLEYPDNRAPVEGVPVHLYLADTMRNEEILLSRTETDVNGRYTFSLDLDKDYRIVVKNYGFFDKVVYINTRNTECTDTLQFGITQISILPEITVRFNVYYEHDKARLTRAARNTIDSLVMPVFDLFPNAIIEIGSHTDNTGSDSYNIRLSQKRSESVVHYLGRKGISPDRMVAQGYGESQPVAPNTNPDGSDNPEGRQLNRRTELRIIGEISTFYLDDE